MKLSAALLLCLTVVATMRGQDQFSPVPLNDPFGSFNVSPVPELSVSGKVLATINNGDYVYPTFSPDGKVLAYAKVIVRGDFENTAVLLYNLSTRKTSILLSPQRAKKYATYKAYVSQMNWKSPRRLEVVISDGDVDSTRLTFDPFTKRLLREKHEGLDEALAQPQPLISPGHEQARQKAVSVFPEFPPDVLESALMNSALVLPDKGIVLQKNYAGHDNNLWFLDFQTRSVKRLINLSDENARVFRGGVDFDSSIIVALSTGPATYLFLYRDEKIKPLTRISSNNFAGEIEVKHRSSEGAVFLVRAHAYYERGDNPLFMFNGERLLHVKEYPELYDVALDPAGQRIAFCYWNGKQRHIVIKELN